MHRSRAGSTTRSVLFCALFMAACSSSNGSTTPAGEAGTAAVSGASGSGVAGAGTSGAAGASGTLGTAGASGSAGTAGVAGGSVAGASGAAGTAGQSGDAGSSAAAGASGAGASGGAAGNAGNAGNAGTSGGSGTAGASGSAGAAGNGGASGAAGSSGSSGAAGSGGALPKITVWIAGDSTVATGGPCPIGWGGQFAPHFMSQVTVKNSAVGGRSVRTWLYDVLATMDSSGECALGLDSAGQPTVQSRWTAMLTGMKAGDYLFIQFGINDSDSTCPRHVGVSAFKSTYGMMAQAAKDRGAQPVFVTPVSSIACTGSTAHGTRGTYGTATVDAGTQYGVPVIDLQALSVALYNARGFCPIPGGTDVSATTGGDVGAFFCDDHTHFDTPGAIAISDLVAQAVKDQGLGLAGYLK